jgi:hypothetical protein
MSVRPSESEVELLAEHIARNMSLMRMYLYENCLTMHGKELLQSAVDASNAKRKLADVPLLGYYPPAC